MVSEFAKPAPAEPPPEPPPPARPGGHPPTILDDERFAIIAVMAVTAIVYARCVGFDFVLDDRMWVNSRFIGDWSFAWQSIIHDSWWFHDPGHLPQSPYYRPLQGILATVIFHLFGANPAGWHSVMIALHLLVAWFAYRAARLLTGNGRTAMLAAAMYALMPQQAQSVIWSTVTDMPMNAAFELAAFGLYLQCRIDQSEDKPSLRYLLLSLGFFAAALLSYDSAVTFPALIAAHALIFPSQNASESEGLKVRVRTGISAMLPYAFVLAAYLAIKLVLLGFISQPFLHNDMTAWELILTIPGAMWAYAMLLIMPWRAEPAAHGLAIARGVADPEFLMPAGGLALLCAAPYLVLRNHPHRRLYLFCAAWTLIALAPALNLRGLRADLLFADRYLYLPAFGFCVMVADLAVTFANTGRVQAQMVAIGATAVVLLYAALLFHDEGYWREDYALYSHSVEKFPEIGIWHSRLGLILSARGDFTNARRELEIGTSKDPDTDGNALYGLGLVDEMLGDRKAALEVMERGFRRFDHPPLIAYTELAIARDAAGDAKGANEALADAAKQPGGANAADLARAKLMFVHDDAKGSEATLRDLLRRDPNYAPGWIFLGTVLASEQKYDDALGAFRHASSLVPYDPTLHYQAAVILHNLKRDHEAHDECTAALAQSPNDPKARALMAAIEQSKAAR
ncbi:MAG TPA: tetratricopeptide repeat protein [Candidatus Binataceae bacterium]|nr:tetratricopeptide repeat protein [Candidatus Binataceae bacterium]